VERDKDKPPCDECEQMQREILKWLQTEKIKKSKNSVIVFLQDYVLTATM
jgi:hypothetical protein